MPVSYDLHTHSTCSDGTLPPASLIEYAAERGVGCIALTDHDSIDGLDAAAARARDLGIGFVTGVEISTIWAGHTIHVVGLGIDPACTELCQGLSALQRQRSERAERIKQRLAERNIRLGACVDEIAGDAAPTRTHFAHALVRLGHAKNLKQAFKRYLAIGKPGHIHTEWIPMATAIEWIVGAGGIAVLAHPLRYRLARSARVRLIEAFAAGGGGAIEVQTRSTTGAQIEDIAACAERYSLLASTGSDYHGPEQRWNDLGRLPALPSMLKPVWHDW